MESSVAEDAVLSDVEDEDSAPLVLGSQITEVSKEKLQEILVELEGERLTRKAAEAAKLELQAQFNRLKVLAHEAIKKRDEALREKEEALRVKESLTGELSEALRLKEGALKERDETARLVDEAVQSRDNSRSEIETAAQLLVNGLEKISGKISSFKSSTGGLPRSSKYSGLPAIAYGVIKRTDEIVEDCLRQIESVTNGRNEVRVQMEQRNYEIAIEVSQLEATISGLKEDLAKRTSEFENLEKLVTAKDVKISEMEREMSEKLGLAEQEARELRQLGEDRGVNLRNLELKIELQRPLLIDQFNYISKTHDMLDKIIKMIDIDKLEPADHSETSFILQEMDADENIHACLDGMRSIYELTKIAVQKLRVEMEERKHEIKGLHETIDRLVMEKQHIGTLLRSALSRKSESLNSSGRFADPSSKTSSVLQVAESGLKDAGTDVRFGSVLQNAGNRANNEKQDAMDKEEDEVFSLAGALENIVKASQLEIIELRHAVEVLRAESSLLKTHLDANAKELSQKKQQIKDLEEKERAANESVEGLMLDIASAEEEISRWKIAAEQEAAVGRAVEEEFVGQLSALKQELEEAKQVVVESESKLRFKEETAAAAMAARDAADKSLRLADIRATRLRERVEELTRQLEELDNQEDHSRVEGNMPRYICWPWQWLGLNFVGYRGDSSQQSSNEMELSEPFIL